MLHQPFFQILFGFRCLRDYRQAAGSRNPGAHSRPGITHTINEYLWLCQHF